MNNAQFDIVTLRGDIESGRLDLPGLIKIIDEKVIEFQGTNLKSRSS